MLQKTNKVKPHTNQLKTLTCFDIEAPAHIGNRVTDMAVV